MFKVDNENSVYIVDITKIMNVDLNDKDKMCRHKAQSLMSTEMT